jgi:hypothetical protein
MNAPAACVIAQQYSSANFVELHFHSHQEKFGARFKIVIIYTFFHFFKTKKMKQKDTADGACLSAVYLKTLSITEVRSVKR